MTNERYGPLLIYLWSVEETTDNADLYAFAVDIIRSKNNYLPDWGDFVKDLIINFGHGKFTDSEYQSNRDSFHSSSPYYV